MNNKETITFDEFRAWLTGLIEGKRGALPDLDDWKKIKKMLDKVVPEKETEIVNIPTPFPMPAAPEPKPWEPWTTPHFPTWVGPNTADPFPGMAPNVWCGGGTITPHAAPNDNISDCISWSTPDFSKPLVEEGYDITTETVSFNPAQLEAAFDLLFTTQETEQNNGKEEK